MYNEVENFKMQLRFMRPNVSDKLPSLGANRKCLAKLAEGLSSEASTYSSVGHTATNIGFCRKNTEQNFTSPFCR